MSSSATFSNYTPFNNGSELGRLVSAFDWSRTPLGPLDQWPQSLRTAVNLVQSVGKGTGLGLSQVHGFVHQSGGHVSVEALKELGYTVQEASGAAMALGLLDRHPEIDIMFTDVVMPEINGRMLAQIKDA